MKKKHFSFLIFSFSLLVMLITLGACSKEESDADKNKEAGEAYLEQNAKKAGVTTTSTGLQYEVIKEGDADGKRPSSTSTVTVNYVGTFIDGSQFDAHDNVSFKLNQVIAGWTEGLQLMKVGAKYRFVIPYYLAYGESDYHTIPAYSCLIFEVELLAVK